MGLRFRKSVKICKGLKLNFGKTGASVTVGSGGFKKTFHTNGNVTTTVGLPGTGIYWTDTERHNSQRPPKRDSADQHNPRITEEPADLYEVSPAVEDYFSAARGSGSSVVSSEQRDSKAIERTTAHEPPKSCTYLSAQNLKAIYAFCDEPVEWTEIISGASVDDLLMDQAKYAYCRTVAPRILSGDIDAYLEVIEEIRPVDDLLLYGGDFEFGTDKPSYIEVEFSAKPENLVPNGTSDSMLEEFLCAVSIRVARDIMALLPVSNVLVHATIESDTVLSVLFTKNDLLKARLKAEDAREIVNGFEHLCVEDFKQLRHVGRLTI